MTNSKERLIGSHAVDTAYNIGSIVASLMGLLILGGIIKSIFTKKK